MPYVRKRGSQLAIVHGERNEDTRQVEQRILFTFYSKAEAREALGENGPGGASAFRSLLEGECPQLHFDWPKLERDLSANLGVLPEVYEPGVTRLRTRFRQALSAFARELELTDPQALMPAAQLLQEHHHELDYVAELIQLRLRLRHQKENGWNTDTMFHWRSALRKPGVPPETEERAVALFESGQHERARAIFTLLIDSFEDYAEGHNYLGLLSCEEEKLADAVFHFQRAVDVGRRLFPKRIAKNRYWTDLATRPYLRGLTNLASTYNQAARYKEALAACDRIHRESGDFITADLLRASILLNTEQWETAAESASHVHLLYPQAALLAAFALVELHRHQDALPFFLHAALNHPIATRLVLGERVAPPTETGDVDDYNVGVALKRSLPGFLARSRRPSVRVLRELALDPRVVHLLREVQDVARRRVKQHPTGEREAFDRLMCMRSEEFARAEAYKLRDLLEEAPTPERRH